VKPVILLGDLVERLRAFPVRARRDAGFQLDRVQRGLDPDDWRPMNTIGTGVREIRVRDMSGVFRVIYVAAHADAIYVLHAFQKKTPRTSPPDIALAQSRLRQLKRGASR
jgi:phage-related protein